MGARAVAADITRHRQLEKIDRPKLGSSTWARTGSVRPSARSAAAWRRAGCACWIEPYSFRMDEQARLEAAIAHDPDDDDAYLVYGDWLQQRGDPRGELLALHHRREDDAARAHLARHASHFYGALAARPKLVEAVWHLGFMRACRFSLDDDRGPGHEQRTLDALKALLALPSMRFIRELSIGVMNVPYNNYRAAIEELGRHDLRTLRRLALGDDIEHSTARMTDPFTSDVGPTRPLSVAAPNLETLILRSTAEDLPELDGIALPRLRELRIEGGGGRIHETLWPAALPELETLAVTGIAATWTPLLHGDAFPKLRHLTIGAYGTLIGRGGVLFANAPLLQQLRTLDLSDTLLGDPDLDAMIANAGSFAHLERLDLGVLSGARSPDRVEALRRACPSVVFS